MNSDDDDDEDMNVPIDFLKQYNDEIRKENRRVVSDDDDDSSGSDNDDNHKKKKSSKSKKRSKKRTTRSTRIRANKTITKRKKHPNKSKLKKKKKKKKSKDISSDDDNSSSNSDTNDESGNEKKKRRNKKKEDSSSSESEEEIITVWHPVPLSEDEAEEYDKHHSPTSQDIIADCEICRLGKDFKDGKIKDGGRTEDLYDVAISIYDQYFGKIPDFTIACMISDKFNNSCVKTDDGIGNPLGLKRWVPSMVLRHFNQHNKNAYRILWDKIIFLERSLKKMRTLGVWNRVYENGEEVDVGRKKMDTGSMSLWLKMSKMQTDLIKMAHFVKHPGGMTNGPGNSLNVHFSNGGGGAGLSKKAGGGGKQSALNY